MKPSLFLLLVCCPVSALLTSKSNIDFLLAQAQLKVEIRVTALQVLSDPQLLVSSLATAEVIRVLEKIDDGGWFPDKGDFLEILVRGAGETQGIGVLASGLPRPHVGRSYRAYLLREDSHRFKITGFEHGLVPLDMTRTFSRNRTDGSDGAGSGAFLYWDDTYFPIPYYISFPTFKNKSNFVSAIDQSFQTWRNPSNIKVEFYALGCSLVTSNENDGTNQIILVQSQWPFEASVIAITRNFYVSTSALNAGQILDSDILLNGQHHKFTTTGESGHYDIQNIVTHEIGHFLGLGHEVSPVDLDATMYTFALPNETKKTVLHTSDLLGIQSAYAGVGLKIPSRSPSCDVNEYSAGCGAIHRKCAGMQFDLILVILGIGVGGLIAGRVFIKLSL